VTRVHLRNVLVGLLITLVVWTFYRANAKDPTEVTGLDRMVLRVSAPLDRAFVVVFSAWVTVYKQWLYRIDLKEENRRLAG